MGTGLSISWLSPASVLGGPHALEPGGGVAFSAQPYLIPMAVNVLLVPPLGLGKEFSDSPANSSSSALGTGAGCSAQD